MSEDHALIEIKNKDGFHLFFRNEQNCWQHHTFVMSPMAAVRELNHLCEVYKDAFCVETKRIVGS